MDAAIYVTGAITLSLLALGALWVLCYIAWLCYRAAVQTKRIVDAHRLRQPDLGKTRRLKFALALASKWRTELFSFYTSLLINGQELPWDVRKPVGPEFYGAGDD